MKMSLFAKVLMIFISSTLLAGSALAHELMVSVTKMRNTKGDVLVSLFNSEDGFPDNPKKAFRIMKLKADQAGRFIIGDLPSGIYALSIAHDENSNGKVDTGFMGIPEEGVGFSRNPNISFGPPKFKDAAYKIEADGQIEVFIKYY